VNLVEFAGRFPNGRWDSEDVYAVPCLRHPQGAVLFTDGHGRINAKPPNCGCSVDQVLTASNEGRPENSTNGAPPRNSPSAAIAPPAAPGPYQTAPLHISSPPSDDILRRVPPHDIEAEQAVLGAILIHNPAIKEILETVGADDFYREAHREIYRCMFSLAQDDIAIDPVTLKDILTQRGKFEAVGGSAYVAELARVVPAPSAIAHYARIVREKAVRRRIASGASQIALAAYDSSDLHELTDSIEQHFLPNATDALSESRSDVPALRKKKGLKMQTAREYLAEMKTRSARTCFLGGLVYAGDVVGLLGRPFTGKSTLACAMTKAWVLDCPSFLGRQCAKARVGYFALERNGSKVAALFEKWGIADEIVFTDFVAPMKPDELVAALEAAIKKHGLEVIVVDHAQSLLRIADTSAYGAVSLALEPINLVAKKTGVAVILLYHQGKPQIGKGQPATDGGDGQINAMGSEAWRAACDVLMETTRSANKRYSLRADVRGGDGLPRTLVKVDLKTGEAVATDLAEAEAQEAAEAVGKYLATQSEPVDYKTIIEAVEKRRAPVVAACQAGYDDGKGIYGRVGEGKSGDPFKYFLKVENAEKSVPGPSRKSGNRPGNSVPVNGQSNDAAKTVGAVERILDGKKSLFPSLDIGLGTAGTETQSGLRAVEKSQFPASREQTLKNGSSGTDSESQNGALMGVAGTAGTAGMAGTGAEGDPAEYQDGGDCSALADSDQPPESDIDFSEEKF
jgi:hypothetical protein